MLGIRAEGGWALRGVERGQAAARARAEVEEPASSGKLACDQPDGAGDRIALSIPNWWSFVVALWGGLQSGATVSPLNPLLTPAERSSVLDHLQPPAPVH